MKIFMTTPEIPGTKRVLDRNITSLNARDIEGYLANQQPNVAFVIAGGPTLHGRDQARQYTEAFWQAFPDGVLAFGDQVLTEESAATEVVFTGTHTGTIMTPAGPLPPTGKRVTIHSCSFLRIKDNLIASEHVYSDQLEMLTQLGLMPTSVNNDKPVF